MLSSHSFKSILFFVVVAVNSHCHLLYVFCPQLLIFVIQLLLFVVCCLNLDTKFHKKLLVALAPTALSNYQTFIALGTTPHTYNEFY
jgi:hypothetical protein